MSGDNLIENHMNKPSRFAAFWLAWRASFLSVVDLEREYCYAIISLCDLRCHHKATFPPIPRSRVAVAMPNALNTRLIVGMLMLYPRSIRDI